MKIYTVHIKPEEVKTLENAVFVPESFSLLAIIFPFNFIQAITHKSWLFLAILLVYFLSSIPLSFADESTSHVGGLVKLAIFPFLGIWANDFWRGSLRRRGYRLEAVVSGKNESEAQLRFFESVNKN